MKNKPSVGDTVYYYNRLGDRFSYTVNGVTGDTLHFANREPAHYKMFQGRIVKKPRKCGECAKLVAQLDLSKEINLPKKRIVLQAWGCNDGAIIWIREGTDSINFMGALAKDIPDMVFEDGKQVF